MWVRRCPWWRSVGAGSGLAFLAYKLLGYLSMPLSVGMLGGAGGDTAWPTSLGGSVAQFGSRLAVVLVESDSC